MERYINLPIQMYASSTATNKPVVDSGTTDGAVADKLTDSTQNFLTTVTVGDYAVVTTGIAGYPVRTWSLITAVDSDTALTISGPGNEAGVAGGLAATGTAYDIIAAADASLCVLSGAKFTQNVQGGDIVCNTTTNLNYTVSSVTDDETLVLSGTNFGILVGDDFFILTDRGSQGATKVRVDNATEIRGNVADGEVTIHYKKVSATNQKLVIAMGDSVSDDAYYSKFKEVSLNCMKSRWRVNSETMPLTVSSGTQGIQWAASFTWS